MHRRIKQYLLTFRLSLIAIAIGSASLGLIPLADFKGTSIQRAIAYGVGIIFWLFTISGYSLFALSCKQRKDISKRLDIVKKSKHKIGILSIFSTFEGTIADVILLFSVVLTIIVLFFCNKTTWYSITAIILLLFSAQMHCILNGENFKYTKFVQSRRVKNAY